MDQRPLPGSQNQNQLKDPTGPKSLDNYRNVHGDIVATTNAAGVKQGVTAVYDPYGTVVTGVMADNAAGAFDFGWVGQHQRPVETETGTQPLIEMGARGYNPTLGRFLETDPIEGGNANDYIYPGDPINMFDLDGLSGGGGGNAGASQRQAQECKKNANTFSCPWTGSGGSWNPFRWVHRSIKAVACPYLPSAGPKNCNRTTSTVAAAAVTVTDNSINKTCKASRTPFVGSLVAGSPRQLGAGLVQNWYVNVVAQHAAQGGLTAVGTWVRRLSTLGYVATVVHVACLQSGR